MKPNGILLGLAAFVATTTAAPAFATLPTPSVTTATREATSYLFHAGAGDVFEIMSSMVAVQKSQNPQVRAFATMLIDHHTMTTNQTFAAAKAGGVMAPPPELSPMQKNMIGRLHAAVPGAGFDRLYLQQQIPAHQMARKINAGFARSGNNPVLRQNASAAIPVIDRHLVEANQLLRSTR